MKNNDVKSVSIRIPINMLAELRYISQGEGRSLNSQILYLIRKCIKEYKTEIENFDISSFNDK